MAQIDDEGFIRDIVFADCYQSSLADVVNQLAGVSSVPEQPFTARLREVFAELDLHQQSAVRDMVSMGAHAALFSILAYLDNVRPMVDGFASQLRLYSRDMASGVETDLNPAEEFHDIFQFLVFESREE